MRLNSTENDMGQEKWKSVALRWELNRMKNNQKDLLAENCCFAGPQRSDIECNV